MGYGGIVIANDTLGDLWFRGNLLWDNYMQGANLLHSINVNTLRPTQNGRHFADDMFKWIFLNENVWIPIEISLKFVPKGPINNIPALVRIMAGRQAIIWTNDDPVQRRIYASLGLNESITKIPNSQFKQLWTGAY